MKKIILAMRPWSFVVSFISVAITSVGLCYLGYPINWWMAVWAALGVVLFHAAANTLSDYFDYKSGVDAEDTYGQVLLNTKQITLPEMLRLSSVLAILALINGVAIWWATGWSMQLLIIGAIGAVVSGMYAWLKFHALGDFAIFCNFGLLPALGTAVVATGALNWEALWFVFLFSPITNAVLHANNMRDIPTDTRANIKTLPMLIGKRAGQIIYYIEVFFPIIWTIVCVCFGKLPLYALFVIISIKMVINNCRDMKRYSEDSHAIDHLDEKTAQLQTISSGLIILTTAITILIEKLF